MSTNARASADPFPFVGHGVGFARKRIQCYLGFAADVDASARPEIVRDCPPPLACSFSWSSRGLCFGSDDALHRRVIDTYPGAPLLGTGLPSTEQWQALSRATETWVRAVHSRWPVAYMIWPLDQELGHQVSPWHARSVEQIPTQILVDLSGKPDDDAQWFADNVARLWRQQLQTRPAAEQEAALAVLSDASRAALERLDLLWTPVEPAKSDDRRELDPSEILAVWRATARDTGNLQEAFEREQQARFANTQPCSFRYCLLWAVRQHGSAQEGLELCEALLVEPDGARDWPALRVQFLIALGRLEEAKAALPAILFDHATNPYTGLENEELLALHDYYAALGDEDSAAIVLHGGAPLGTYLQLYARSAGRQVPARAPARAATRFAELYDAWLTPAWKPERLTAEALWRCERVFDKLAKRPLAAKRDDVARRRVSASK